MGAGDGEKAMWFSFIDMHIIYFGWFSFAEPDVYKEVKQKLDLGSVKFEVILFITYYLDKPMLLVVPCHR